MYYVKLAMRYRNTYVYTKIMNFYLKKFLSYKIFYFAHIQSELLNVFQRKEKLLLKQTHDGTNSAELCYKRNYFR